MTNSTCLIDNFLDEKTALYLWNYFQIQDFSFINGVEWRKVYRLQDGNPLRGPSFEFEFSEKSVGNDKDIYFFINNFIRHNQKIQSFFKDKIEKFHVSLNAFPAGTALSWHKDGRCKGAFIYYVHPVWGAHWGGELLVAEGKNSALPIGKKYVSESEQKIVPPAFDPSHDNRCLLEEAHGRYFMAKPNRLILLKPNTNHMVKPVTNSAGAHMRCSISGFFY